MRKVQLVRIVHQLGNNCFDLLDLEFGAIIIKATIVEEESSPMYTPTMSSLLKFWAANNPWWRFPATSLLDWQHVVGAM
jgi:hypothetical protein